VNFGYQEGHHFKFQNSDEWKSLKLWNEAGPTCQSQQLIKPLAPGYRSPAHARVIAVGHMLEARAPPATRSTPCSSPLLPTCTCRPRVHHVRRCPYPLLHRSHSHLRTFTPTPLIRLCSPRSSAQCCTAAPQAPEQPPSCAAQSHPWVCLHLKHGHHTGERPQRSMRRRCCQEAPPRGPGPPATKTPRWPVLKHHTIPENLTDHSGSDLRRRGEARSVSLLSLFPLKSVRHTSCPRCHYPTVPHRPSSGIRPAAPALAPWPSAPIFTVGCQPRPSRPKQLGQLEASPGATVPRDFF
jgi:hypothetical protein